MADRLAALFAHFAVRAETFQAGPLCGVNSLEPQAGRGQLHLVREGGVEVHHGTPEPLRIEEPSLLLYPRPLPHRFVTDPSCGAQFLCAHMAFEGGASHPIAAALPDWVCLPLATVPSCEPVLALLFAEAEATHCGRQLMLDRLFEVLLIWVVRELMAQGRVDSGMLAGLAHPRLRGALVALHDAPQREWSLEELAAAAGMSRTVFANAIPRRGGLHARGLPAALAHRAWRKRACARAGPSSTSRRTWATAARPRCHGRFGAHTGQSPREWRKAQVPAG